MVECPECEGTGTVWVSVYGGSWNSYYGTWEPDEKEELCERCGGLGYVDPEDDSE